MMLGDLGPAYRVTGKLAEISDVHTLPGADRLLQKCRLPALLLGLTQEHRLPYQETGRSSVLPARKELEHPWGSESRECGTMPTGLAGCLMDTGGPQLPRRYSRRGDAPPCSYSPCPGFGGSGKHPAPDTHSLGISSCARGGAGGAILGLERELWWACEEAMTGLAGPDPLLWPLSTHRTQPCAWSAHGTASPRSGMGRRRGQERRLDRKRSRPPRVWEVPTW